MEGNIKFERQTEVAVTFYLLPVYMVSYFYLSVNYKQSRKEKLHQGCYSDGSNPVDLEHLVWSSGDNSVDKCMKACQTQGYIFSGLRVRQG